ncbi:aminotransferase class I/II-fold pyridoxal phosphate-dependent enzyme [Streptomyces sp. URMC 123]|uniref:aminotransferase class I/II-fold pyridoxal phosphate-dependent enzyme n=1 Tax=Streptomyces sp. URMC 123 TaxID=3423403 RepID=UPI003F1A14DD
MTDPRPREEPAFIGDAALLRRRRTFKWRAGDGRPDRLCLGVAEMDLYTPAFLREALDGALHLGELGYGLCQEQEEACEKYLSEHHGASVAGLRGTTDVLAGLRTVLRLDLPPGSPVIVETPVFGELFTVIREAGLTPLPVPLLRDARGYRHDWSALGEAATSGARGWIVCQPHNPVGRCWTEEEQARAVSLALEHDLLLLANEVHIPLGLSRQPRSAFADPAIHRARSYGFTSASKAFNTAGLKSATVYASDRSAAALAAMPQSLLGRPGSLGAIATVACYDQGTDWLRTLRGALADRVRQVLDELAALPLAAEAAVPDSTYLVWAEFPRGDDAVRFGEAVAASGVHLLPGPGFGGPDFAHCFRVNVAAHPEVIREAFARIRTALRPTAAGASRPPCARRTVTRSPFG